MLMVVRPSCGLTVGWLPCWCRECSGQRQSCGGVARKRRRCPGVLGGDWGRQNVVQAVASVHRNPHHCRDWRGGNQERSAAVTGAQRQSEPAVRLHATHRSGRGPRVDRHDTTCRDKKVCLCMPMHLYTSTPLLIAPFSPRATPAAAWTRSRNAWSRSFHTWPRPSLMVRRGAAPMSCRRDVMSSQRRLVLDMCSLCSFVGFCREGMRRAARSLARAVRDGADLEAREDMCVASLLGGLALANAKLGT